MDFSALPIGFLSRDLLPEVFQESEIFLVHPFAALVKVAVEGLLLRRPRGDDIIEGGVEGQVLSVLDLGLLAGVVVVPGVHVRQDVEMIIECRNLDVRLHGLMVSVVGQVNVELVDVPEV